MLQREMLGYTPPSFSLNQLYTNSHSSFPIQQNFKKFSSRPISKLTATPTPIPLSPVPNPSIKLLFVEMGVGYDQHGQDVTKAAMRACKDAIASNSVPAFRAGSIPGISFEEMKLQIKIGVPRTLQNSLDIEKVKSVFPYGGAEKYLYWTSEFGDSFRGEIVHFEVVDGGLICSSGVHVEEMGDKTDDCYIVNVAVYVGY